jgi:hypothetical protein
VLVKRIVVVVVTGVLGIVLVADVAPLVLISNMNVEFIFRVEPVASAVFTFWVSVKALAVSLGLVSLELFVGVKWKLARKCLFVLRANHAIKLVVLSLHVVRKLFERFQRVVSFF